jgi:hypothetical protein
MKTKLFAMFMAVTAASTAVSSAVSVSVAGIANSSVGFVTLNGSNVSGRAIFVSTGTALTLLLPLPRLLTLRSAL